MDRKHRAPALFVTAFWALLPWAARAQADPAAPTQGDVEARVEELENKLTRQERKIEEQERKISELEEAKEAEFAQDEDEYSSKEMLNVYGFFDIKYIKGIWDEDSPYNLYFPAHGSFMMTNINLYFASHMADTLDALIELRLSYLPLGAVNDNYVTEAYSETGVSLGSAGEWMRINTAVRDPGTSVEFQQGGISIERVHLTWAPRDYFKILVGRYLTPYGIWNIDHGSPVILTVVTPYMQTRELMPLAQTGFQIFGRFFPAPRVFLDYAVTLSNGRGAMDSVMDLDENKGIGLKLKMSYESRKLTAALGGYGFYGKGTESTFHTHLILDSEGTMSESADEPLTYREEISNQYSELMVSADLLLEFDFGLRLQSEFIFRRFEVESPRAFYSRETLFAGASILTDHLFQSSNTGHGYYILVGWELPFAALRPVKITPYFMWEDTRGYDTFPYVNFKLITAGLNVKPSPFVTLKLEYLAGLPESDVYGEPMQVIQAQVAVSF